MTTTTRDAQALTYLATRLRDETHGCGKWDQNGTYAVIAELVGQSLAETLHRVIGHALDPEARTPGAIKRPFVPKRPEEPGRRQPAKAGEDCKRHPGEYVGACRPCAVEHLDAPTDPVIDDQDCTAGRQLLAEIRARRGVAETMTIEAPTSGDERPETACAVDGCFRPTRDGICDRCRAKAIADDEAAANAELIERLRANERERALTRPEPDPSAAAPRRFTSDDIDYDRVHAAMARAGTRGADA